MIAFIDNTPFPDIFSLPDDQNLLFQGDIIKYNTFLQTEKENLGFIILSNSCDLERLKNKGTISIAPIYSFNFVLDDMMKKAFRKTKNVLENFRTTKKKGVNFDYIKHFIDLVSNFILEESNYKKKYTFFLSPLQEFDVKPTIAHIEHVNSIDKKFSEVIIKHRIRSIKPPWREKLGFKVGNLYSRVATYTPKISDIRDWWIKTYNEIFEEKREELENLE